MSHQNSDISNPTEDTLTGPRYWKSLDEIQQTPAFQEWVDREFPEGASEGDSVDRRHFMKIMAASFGLAGVGLAGCRRPKLYVLPYAQQPENVIPGVPIYYSSSMPGPYENSPLVVETHSARPTKVEGNPSYLPGGGATSIYAQSSCLDLYDPDRSTKPVDKSGNELNEVALQSRLEGLQGTLQSQRGKGVAFLAEGSASPTRRRLVEKLKTQYPNARWAEYNAVDFSNPEKILPQFEKERIRSVYHFEKAKRILSLDGDFLSTEPGNVQYSRAFAKTRKVKDSKEASKMSRLYVAESDLTLTGAQADHRARVPASEIPALAALFAAEIVKLAGGDSLLIEILEEKGRHTHISDKWVEECAKDLWEQRGKSVVFAGSHQSSEVHILTAVINGFLQAPDHDLVDYFNLPETHAETIETLAEAIQGGEVETLIILGGNPAYDAPSNLDWAALQESVPQVIRYGYYHDETSALADLHVPASHYLESWGDGLTWDGFYVPVQPMIEPLFQTIDEVELLSRILGEMDNNSFNQVRMTYEQLFRPANLEQDFNVILSEGVSKKSVFERRPVQFATRYLNNTVVDFQTDTPDLGGDSLEVRLVPDASVWDGRYINNGWLQECPDPLSKLTWDNAILVSPRLAKKLQDESGYPLMGDPGIMQDPLKQEKFSIQVNKGTFNRGREFAPMAELTVGGKTVRGPIHVMPGLASYTVILPLGYGREKTGRVGQKTGFNFYSLKESGSTILTGGTLKILEDEAPYKLANTQQHWSMEGRALIREATVDDYANSVKKYKEKYGEEGSFVDTMGMESHSPPVYGKAKDKSIEYKALNQPRGGSLYETPAFGAPPSYIKTWRKEENKDSFIPPQQWGMTIDLNLCTGCNACVVACQSENNIPIVGKDQVLLGREMHWIRLDRYFSGSQEQGNYDDQVSGSHSAAPTHAVEELPIPEDVQVSFQGVACMHCELAPCENVCPVNATVHDNQGLNVMAYNRCVGTRYCANNCPYKVRRFNFFDWNKRQKDEVYKGPFGEKNVDAENGEIIEMRSNPDVTIRMRGVMEKCTYCVQRIESGKINHKVAMAKAGRHRDIHVPDGQIKTACQQVCPAEAIEFGDITDTESRVYQSKMNDRDYSVLGYLNTRPRTTFLARLRNPNPQMPDHYTQPFTRQSYESRYGHVGDHGKADSHNGHSHSENGAH